MSTKLRIGLCVLIALLLLIGLTMGPDGKEGAPTPAASRDSVPPAEGVSSPADPDVDAEKDPERDVDAAMALALKRAAASRRPAASGARRPVSGRVAADDSDEPVAGAVITLRWDYIRSGGRWPAGGVYEWTVRTDYRGEFRFDELPVGHYSVVAGHPDYASRGRNGVVVREAGDANSLPVRLIRDPLKLGIVAGMVLSPFGDAIEGAVVVVSTFQRAIQQTTTTGADGSFRIERLHPGPYTVSVAVPSPSGEAGPPSERERRTVVRAGETTRVDFRGSGTLTGTLLDSAGRPVAKARILLTRVKGGPAVEERRGTTDEEGRFSLPDAGVGRRKVVLGWEGATVFGDDIELSGYDQTVDLRVGLGEIVSKVMLADGRSPAVAGAVVVLVAYHLEGAETGAVAAYAGIHDGISGFRMGGLAPGRYRVKLIADGYRSQTVDLEITWDKPKVRQDFTIEPLVFGTVRLAVKDTAGKLLDDVRVADAAPTGNRRTFSPATPAPGVYIVRMEVGSRTLTLSGAGLEPKTIAVEVRKDVETKVEVTLSRAP